MEQPSPLPGRRAPLRPSPEVVARRLDSAGVLVHLQTNRVFELNSTGIRIWELVVEGLGADEIAARLSDEFVVDEARAATEVDEFIARFRLEGLLLP